MTESSWTPQSICARAAELACFHDPYVSTGERNGAIVCERYGVGGARGEAQGGFPSVLVGLRRLHVDRHFGECEQIARLNALLEIMSQLNDTCILHRGGEYGLTRTQEGAKRVLRQGGVGCVSGIKALQAFDNLLESLNLSPGGSADLLAAALMLDRITGVGREYAC
jgi:triphosphoribosyl-dephospho-CoA synthase